jgi:flagellar capping protein FliD
LSDSPFQVTGIASGISWDEIIAKTLEAARKPEQAWQKKIDTLEYKKSLYQELSSSLFKLRNTLTSLRLPSMFKSKTAEFNIRNAGQVVDPLLGTVKASKAEDIVKATVSADAAFAQWKIDVTQLASKQQVYSNKFDLTTKLGTLGITGSFKIRIGTQVAEVKVDSTDTIRTLNQKIATLKDQNGDRMLVTSQIIDGRLVFESAASGLDNTGKKAGETFTYAATDGNTTYLPKPASTTPPTLYPPKILSLKVNGANYVEGTDFNYSATDGKIVWIDSAAVPTSKGIPAAGAKLELNYSEVSVTIPSTSGPGNSDSIPKLPADPTFVYTNSEYAFDVYNTANGAKYVEGVDYNILWTPGPDPKIEWINVPSPGTSVPAGTGVTVVVKQGIGGPGAFVENNYSTNNNEFVFDDGGSGLLQALGLVDGSGNLLNKTDAADAILTVNGITVTRPDNVIENDDLIAGVKLELIGIGDVTMNITQDAKKAIEAVQAFSDAYNETMTWVNEKLEEKYSSATIDDSDDYLKNLLKTSKGTTVFGALHGDQLLWSIKNQLRNMVANPVTTASQGLATKKYRDPAESLGLTGEFYIYASGQALKIKLKPGDSLEDIQDTIQSSFSVTSKNGIDTTAIAADLKLNVYIRDGQLVVEHNAASTLTSPRTEVIMRNYASTGNYDVIPAFTVTKESPINCKLSMQVGDYTTDKDGNKVPPTFYYEGTDFEVVNVENASGALESRINWLPNGNKPADGEMCKVTYEFNPGAVAFSTISGGDDIKTLGFHVDSSKSQLSSFGLKTTEEDYGKSGLLVFDSDALFSAMSTDGNNTSNTMTSFFRGLDTYIGNLVDSSQVLVAGTAVTKGRIAGAMLSIDVEVETLNSQITKLERQLAERQTSMYKQYSNMELAIQKLNAQMSSLSQYLSNTASK